MSNLCDVHTVWEECNDSHMCYVTLAYNLGGGGGNEVELKSIVVYMCCCLAISNDISPMNDSYQKHKACISESVHLKYILRKLMI